MKRFTMLVCLLLIASMILAIPTLAAEQASDFFMSHSSYLWEISDSEFQVWFRVTAVEGMDVLGVREIKVQRSTDKSNWSTVQTYGGQYDYDTSFYSGHVTYSSAEAGYYYRARVTYYAENSSGTATYIDYTSYI